MITCVFCNDRGVTTINTTTPSVAYPFLCAQLGVTPDSPMSPAALCSSFHNLWEEVTLLYTNMQGLLNLMGRRVGQFRQKLRKDNDQPQPQSRAIGMRMRSTMPRTDVGATTTSIKDIKGPKRQKESVVPLSSSVSSETMLNWFYPSTSTGANNSQSNQNLGGGVVVTATDNEGTTVGGEIIVKSEAFDGEEKVDLENVNEDLMEMEDVETIPEVCTWTGTDLDIIEEVNNDDENDEEDDLSDPNYDPDADVEKKGMTNSNEKGTKKDNDCEHVENASFEMGTTQKHEPKLNYLNHSYICYKIRRPNSSKDYWKCSTTSCGGLIVKTGENMLSFTKPHDVCLQLGVEIVKNGNPKRKRAVVDIKQDGA